MKIKGLQKLTLLDYPERVACTVFLAGCNFRCPFCHNSDIVTDAEPEDYIDEQYFFSYLKKRAGILDGVCVTGGEPLLSPDTPSFIKRIKELGYLVKLDTNGAYPERLEALVTAGLVDYVAVDIKNTPEKYIKTAGCTPLQLEAVKKTVAYLLEGHVGYEFRTTVSKPLHSTEDIRAISEWIKGARGYYIQPFVQSENVPDRTLCTVSRDELYAMLNAAKKSVPAARIRGLE